MATLYIKDGEVIKYRGKDVLSVTQDDINTEIANKNKVIVVKGRIMNCYFKDEDKWLIENEIIKLKRFANINNLRNFIIIN